MNYSALILNRYTMGAAVAIALAAGGLAYRSHVIEAADAAGYSRAMTEVQLAQAQMAREQARETSRLIDKVRKTQDAYNKQTADVAAFSDRARVAERRMRDQARDIDARIKAASAASLRNYAQASERNFERCTGHVERFAVEAASCSAAAQALNH